MTNSSNVPLDPGFEGEARPAAAPVPDPTRWRALGVIAIAQLMVVLDSTSECELQPACSRTYFAGKPA
jgi:hypothetical protein